MAPYRFEIDPAKIAALLPETFIAECEGRPGFRIRLAGTKICEQFGRELRGIDFLALWTGKDRDTVASLIGKVINDGAVAHGRFRATTRTGRKVSFEFVLLPLIHNGTAANRLLGAITAIEPPFWLGAEPLERQELLELHLHWPDEVPAFMVNGGAEVVRLVRGRFRVVEGGLKTRFVP
jgi:hypothetical protein